MEASEDDRAVPPAAQESKAPKAWTFQDDFLRAATGLVKRVFVRLGVEPVPALGLVAFPSWTGEERQPVVERLPGLRWDPNPADWVEEIVAAEKQFESESNVMLWVSRSSSRTLGFREVARSRLERHDRDACTRSFLTQAASVLGYAVAIVLEFDGATYERFPAVQRPAHDARHPRDVEVSLLRAASEAVLERLFQELCKGNAGLRDSTDQRDADDILRDAGERLLSSVQWTLLDSVFTGNLFEQINAISNLRYESAEGRGGIVFGPQDADGGYALCFTEPVPLARSVWARKSLQMTSERFLGYSDTENLRGLVERRGGEPEFRVGFKGQSRWEMGHGEVVLADVRLGIPSFPIPRLRWEAFDAAFRRVFPLAEREGIDRIWALVDIALEQRHGTMIAVADEAALQASRLASQATPIEPTFVTPDAFFRATAIDGAILLDTSGTCHAVGVILDGQANRLGDPARGARFNSAVRYVNDAAGRLVVVVSEDGHVDMFPRLRPPIEKTSFHRLLNDVRAHGAGPMSAALRNACARLLRYYWDYVPYDDWMKVVKGARVLPWDDDHNGMETFEQHASDFIEEPEENQQ